MRRLFHWVAFLILLLSRAATAQDAAAPVPEPDTKINTKAVEEIEPSIYYLQNEEGRLVPMFGFQLDDFMRAFKQLQGLHRKETPPRYIIEEISAEGKAEGRTAKLSIRFLVRLLETGPVRVPLGLGEAVVVQSAGSDTKDVTAKQLLEHANGDGYVVWLSGETEKSQEVSFDVLVPLKTVGGETSLRLQMPRSTKSVLRLTVPESELRADGKKPEESALETIQGQVSQDATLETVADDGAKSVQFVARGLRSDFELSWHDSKVSTTRTPTVLAATGRILSRIDDHSVNTEATLEISGHGSPFDRFRVRLPAGAELISSSPPGHTVVEIPIDEKEAKNYGPGNNGSTKNARPVARQVEIHLPKKTLGPVKIRLATRQSHSRENSGRLVELSGFAVEGAARQWGHIALAVADDVHVSWDQQYRVKQVDELPGTLQNEDVVAGFAYSSQPFSLNAWVVPRKTRLGVEPEHIIFVDGNGVRLNSKLRYTVRGKKAFLLEIDMADWELDEVGPASTVAIDGIDVDKTNVLHVPLLRRSAGKIEITLKAHRRLPADTKQFKLRLPVPRVSTSGSAAIVVQPADNIELMPNDNANVELTRQQASGVEDLPPGYQQRPLFYRGDAANAVFSGERSIHPRKVTVDVKSQAVLDHKTCRVSQRFSYQIDYQPLRFLEIDVPRPLAAQSELEFEVDGRKAIATALANNDGRAGKSDTTAMAISLFSPGRIGQLELAIRYSISCKALPPQAGIVREIPLVMPRDTGLVGNRLSVKADPPLKLSVNGDAWTLENDAETTTSQRSLLKLSNPKPSNMATVSLYSEQRSQHKSTLVEKAWICTDLTGDARQDWAAFRIYSSLADIDVFVPEGVEFADVDLFLDGRAVRPIETSGSRLRVALPAGSAKEHLVELRYHCPGGRAKPGRMSLILPHVGDEVWNRRLYWELVLPRDEHVMFDPLGFVNEYTWGWNGFFWGQKPVCDTGYLADWIGIWHESRTGGQTELPGESTRHGTNRYVFSTSGKTAACEFYTVGRSWIVLWASCVALVAGMALIYIPPCRHPAVLMAAGIGLLASGLAFPSATLLALQAAALGLVLAIMAGILQISLSQQRRSTTILETGSSILEQDSTQTQHVVPAPVADSTQSKTGI